MNKTSSQRQQSAKRTSAQTAKSERSATGTGAVQSRTGLGDRGRSYWLHHKTSFGSSLSRLLSTPLQTLMTSLVVAIALALPTILLIALENVQSLGQSWDEKPKISAYINVRARPAAIEQLLQTLDTYPEIEQVVYLTPDQALEDFQHFSGFGSALSGLDANPLPATLIITPKDSAVRPAQLQEIKEKLAQQAIVDEATLDMDWVRRLQELMLLGKKIVLALASLLGLGVLLAVGNTIRLAIENRREEILVAKLVGGTNGFVRRPLLYSGGWYGFIGGLLACLIVAIGYFAVEPTVLRLAALYQSDFRLYGLDISGVLQLLTGSTLLGWLGAWLAVGRHLSEIEPK